MTLGVVEVPTLAGGGRVAKCITTTFRGLDCGRFHHTSHDDVAKCITIIIWTKEAQTSRVAKCIIWTWTWEHTSSLDVAKCIMPHVTREGRQELPLHNATRASGGAAPGVTLRHQEDPWRGFSLVPCPGKHDGLHLGE